MIRVGSRIPSLQTFGGKIEVLPTSTGCFDSDVSEKVQGIKSLPTEGVERSVCIFMNINCSHRPVAQKLWADLDKVKTGVGAETDIICWETLHSEPDSQEFLRFPQSIQRLSFCLP